MNINTLCNLSHQNAKDKGFWDKERNIGELLMLITSELAEALEAHRKNRTAKSFDIELMQKFSIDVYNDDTKEWEVSDDFKAEFEENVKDTFEDEIADVFIRLGDLCGGLGINIDAHIACKMAYNKTREHLHGKAY